MNDDDRAREIETLRERVSALSAASLRISASLDTVPTLTSAPSAGGRRRAPARRCP